MGCDWRKLATRKGRAYFNPRTRVGCDVFKGLRDDKKAISIHAPGWGATNYLRLQGGQRFISIHAPAWGATPVFIRAAKLVCISIHAPAWGATLAQRGLRAQMAEFQSTHPGGVRPELPKRHSSGSYISIHAPGWGATVCDLPKSATKNLISIHAPGWGATALFLRLAAFSQFQSTHPGGVRPSEFLFMSSTL